MWLFIRERQRLYICLTYEAIVADLIEERSLNKGVLRAVLRFSGSSWPSRLWVCGVVVRGPLLSLLLLLPLFKRVLDVRGEAW